MSQWKFYSDNKHDKNEQQKLVFFLVTSRSTDRNVPEAFHFFVIEKFIYFHFVTLFIIKRMLLYLIIGISMFPDF